MRAVIQRVSSSSVSVNGEVIGKIGRGLNVLIGFSHEDTLREVQYMVDKIIKLRIFEDENDKMNLSVEDINGEILVLSQFTLYGDVRKGRRPSFTQSMGQEPARKLYEECLQCFRESCDLKIQSGMFQEMMKVDIVNEGPVTIMLSSEKEF